MDRFEDITSVGSSMKGPDAPVDRRYKNGQIALVGSRSGGPDAIRRRYIRAVIAPF